jgi:hypothetical protein
MLQGHGYPVALLVRLILVLGYRRLEGLDIGSLLTLGAGGYVKRDALAFLKGLEATRVDC